MYEPLKAVMKKHRYTYTSLGKDCGFANNRLNYIMADRADMKVKELLKLAEVLNIKIKSAKDVEKFFLP